MNMCILMLHVIWLFANVVETEAKTRQYLVRTVSRLGRLEMKGLLTVISCKNLFGSKFIQGEQRHFQQ